MDESTQEAAFIPFAARPRRRSAAGTRRLGLRVAGIRAVPSFLCAVALLLASRAEAGATLRWRELNRQGGSAVRTTAVAYSGEAGLRLEVSEGGSSGSKAMTFLYRAASRTLYVREGQGAWSAITPDLLERVQSLHVERPAERASVIPTNTRHEFAGFSCRGYQLTQPGLPSRLVCLATPADLRLDETTQRHFREFGRILAEFLKASATGAPTQEDDAHITFNTYGIPGGFPVREWEYREGELSMDSQLVEIEEGEPPATMFQNPAP